MLVGVLSDTHGTLPSGVLAALEGVDLIIHAGDIGPASVLTELESIAPVTAVRGNMDHGPAFRRLPTYLALDVGGQRLFIGHMLEMLESVGIPPLVAAVIHGHTHKASMEQRGRALYLNPGSSGGYSRDGRGATLIILDLSGPVAAARIVEP